MVKAVRSRSRKINFKSRIAVRHANFDFGDEQALDYNEVQEAGQQAQDKPDHVETGVDKEEESELHLQNAIVAAQAALISRSGAHQTRSAASGPVASSSKPAAAALPHIPTPDATGTVEDYESLYSTHCYVDPKTYIRFSDTVEEATGVAYNMDEDDEDWLNQFNSELAQRAASTNANAKTSTRHSPGRKDKGKEPADDAQTQQLSESDFELIMDHFETVTEEKMPLLHIDPSKMPSFVDFEPTFADSPYAHKLEPLRQVAKKVYEYWKQRRLERSGKVIMPSLDHDESREDNPYVCFRRRDPKNVRKTRRTESQNLDRLVRLSTDLQAAYELTLKVLDRERLKKENLTSDRAVFEGRVQLREAKRKCGEKAGDDELLITRKEKRRRPEDLPQQLSASSVGHKIPIRIPARHAMEALPPGQTVPATPVVTQPAWLSQEHSTAILQRIDREVLRRREADHDWEDFTDGAYQPAQQLKAAQYWKEPQTFSVDSQEALGTRREVLGFSDRMSGAVAGSRPSFRRRTGRGGRVVMDRIPRSRAHLQGSSPSSHTRQLRSNAQWKFDSDADELLGQGAPAVVDDTELKYQLSRMDLFQPGDLASLHPNPQHLHDAQAWISRPAEKAPPTQIIGKISYRPTPPQPPVQPIAQQHQTPQNLPQPSAPGSMPSQHSMLASHNNALMSLKRASVNGGSPQLPNGVPLPHHTGSPMPQPPSGPRRMPSNSGPIPQHLLQQLPNGQMMAQQWNNKMDPAALQNLVQAQAQAQAHSLSTPRLPTQYPGVNGTPRLQPQYPMMSPNGLSPFSDASGISRPSSVAANGSPSQQGPKQQQMLPPQPQAQPV